MTAELSAKYESALIADLQLNAVFELRASFLICSWQLWFVHCCTLLTWKEREKQLLLLKLIKIMKDLRKLPNLVEFLASEDRL